MAFKLTKDETTQRNTLSETLEEKATAVVEAVTAFNETVKEAKEAIETALEAYNGTLEEAREFAAEVASRLREEFDRKSERWQESNKGASVSEFIDQWTDVELDDVEPHDLDIPEDLEEPDLEHAEVLNNLPDAIET